jgi:hypothetical protein
LHRFLRHESTQKQKGAAAAAPSHSYGDVAGQRFFARLYGLNENPSDELLDVFEDVFELELLEEFEELLELELLDELDELLELELLDEFEELLELELLDELDELLELELLDELDATFVRCAGASVCVAASRRSKSAGAAA